MPIDVSSSAIACIMILSWSIWTMVPGRLAAIVASLLSVSIGLISANESKKAFNDAYPRSLELALVRVNEPSFDSEKACPFS